MKNLVILFTTAANANVLTSFTVSDFDVSASSITYVDNILDEAVIVYYFNECILKIMSIHFNI